MKALTDKLRARLGPSRDPAGIQWAGSGAAPTLPPEVHIWVATSKLAVRLLALITCQISMRDNLLEVSSSRAKDALQQ